MINNTIEKVTDRIPLKERNEFQSFLIEITIGKKASLEDKLEWAIKNGKLVSDIIDNTQNENIRSLIMVGKYKEASELVLVILNEIN